MVKDIPTKAGPKECALPFLDSVLAAQNLQWGSYEWTFTSSALLALVKDAVSKNLGSPSYASSAIKAMQAAFSNVFTSSRSAARPWKLGRFASLHATLSQSVLPQVITQALAESQPIINSLVHSTFCENYGRAFPAGTFTSLDERIRGCMLQQLHAATAHPAGFIKHASADQLKLEEDEQSAQERGALQTKLEQLQGAVQAIKHISNLQASSASVTAQQEHVVLDISLDDDDEEDGMSISALVPVKASRDVFDWPETTPDSNPRRRKLTRFADEDATAAAIKTPDGKKMRTKEPAMGDKKRLRPTPVPSA